MAQNIRQAAVAGKFYEGDSDALSRSVARCYNEAATIAPLSKAEQDSTEIVQAVIVPHAGYVFSGAVAASAFMRIDSTVHYDRIFLLGPSHHVAFDGASVANVFSAYRTPSGDVPVDTAMCNLLIKGGDGVFSYIPAAHDKEHCLEVQLPFLQYRMNDVPPIVPIILGTQNINTLKRVADKLKQYFTPNNLFVISSDFSHYPSYRDAEKVDGNTGRAIETGRLGDFVEALAENDSLHIRNLYTSACGQCAIAVLLMMESDGNNTGNAQGPAMRMRHIAYLNSGDSQYGGKDQVVGYHSFVLTRPLAGEDNVPSSTKEANQDSLLTENDKQQLLNVAWNAISPAKYHREIIPTKVFERKLGVFVTLTKNGRLRGCIGHFGEDVPLGELTKRMARAAAFEDPRFSPVREQELNDINIEISVLTPLKRIHDISEFNYGKQGIYIKKGFHSGTFLPQVADEVNWTKEEFLGHCSRDKAGIGWDGWRSAELYTYEAIIF